MNRSLAERGIHEKLDHRSYKRQGIEKSRLYIWVRGGFRNAEPVQVCHGADQTGGGQAA